MNIKLKLNLDDLSVDSFDTAGAQKQKGTVFGEQCTCWTQCGQNTCPGCPTCDATCNATCGGATCAGSCYGTCGGDTCGASCYGTCDYSCDCNSYYPCPSAMYTHCGNVICY
jgi:hypothetical protein